MNKTIKFTLRITLVLLSMKTLTAQGWSNVAINGFTITQQQLDLMQEQLGYRVPAGNYLVNYQNGCWVNVSNGQGGCPGTNQQQQTTSSTYNSRYGSGEQYSNGDWSYYSNVAGGGVGGSNDGCIYAGSWSNC